MSSKIIGITGGVGSGKSTVLDYLKNKYKAHIIMADDIGHEALEPGTKTHEMIVEHFGQKITDDNKTISHKKLADIIFNNDKERNYINTIIHPYALDRIKAELKKYNDSDNMTVIETALMFETTCDRLCDEVWGVITDDEIRIDRLINTRNYSREKAIALIASQLSNAELINKCDRIITNNDSYEELKENIDSLILL